MKYHESNGQLTKAGCRLWDKAKKAIEPLIRPAKDGWDAKEREMVIASALSSVRVLRSVNVMKPIRKS